MKKFKLLLVLGLLILVLIYVYIRINDPEKQNYYELNSGFYLEKIDYFSQYSVVKKTGSDYLPFISDVEELCFLDNGCLIKFEDKSEMKFLYLSEVSDKQIVSDNISDFEEFISARELVWMKPRSVVEMKTLSNNYKLFSQIILMMIIIIVFVIIMKGFNLTRLSGKP
jgi:uncharacterized integral membrane protein